MNQVSEVTVTLQVTAETCMRLILERFPGFSVKWERHRAFWGDEAAGFVNDMGAFSDYVARLIAQEEHDLLPGVFALAEELLVSEDARVGTAVATGFLENLLNMEVSPRAFVPLLGPKSRAYCKAWDEFTGVRTEGL